MARDRGVAMAPDEVAGFLDEHRTVTLGTIGPDGMPHLAAMWFGRDGADLLMWTYRSSQKARNVERDPRASVLAEAGGAYDQLRGVCLDCRVELVGGADAVLAIGRMVHDRYADTGPYRDGAAAEAALRAQAAKRVGLRLRVERIRSWDHRKLAGRRT